MALKFTKPTPEQEAQNAERKAVMEAEYNALHMSVYGTAYPEYPDLTQLEQHYARLWIQIETALGEYDPMWYKLKLFAEYCNRPFRAQSVNGPDGVIISGPNQSPMLDPMELMADEKRQLEAARLKANKENKT